MADSPNIIGQFKNEIVEVTENVTSEAKDQLEQAAEQGLQSIVGTRSTLQQTPQQVQLKQQEDQMHLTEARRKIKWYKDIEEAQRRVREERKQKDMQRLQQAENKKQEEQVKVIEKKQQKQVILAPTPMNSIENKSKMAA